MEKLHRDSDAYTRDYNVFVSELRQFHQSRGTAFRHTPRINGREVDLYLLYNQVTALGGWQKVNDGYKWDGVLDSLKLPKSCANVTLALRQIYIRYLGHYEKIHYLGEDPDDDNDQTPEGRSRKHQTSLHNVPMVYNHAQHEITEFQRTAVAMCQQFVYPNDYNKLCLSLLSGLPNEQDFALNICTLLSNEGRHVLHLEKVPRLVDLLVAQAGVFPDGDTSLADLYRECWEGVEGRQMSRFWQSTINMADQDVVELLLASCGVTNVERRDDDLFNLDNDLGARNSEGQRVLRIALILYNLSFESHNVPVLASNSPCLRFLLLCVHCQWSYLRQVALDTLGNLAGQIAISLKADLRSRLMLRTVSEGIDSNDRFVVLRSLEILAHLAQLDSNDEVLGCCVDFKVFQRIMALLTIHDIMLLVYSLEALYSLSELGRKICEKILRVHKAVATLVSLLTLDPQISGPGEGNFKLVETFEPVSADAAIPTTVNTVSNSVTVPVTQPIATPVPLHNPGPSKANTAQQTQVSTLEVDSESFACHWLRSAYEMCQGSSVSRNELYAEYVSHCSKVGKKCVVNANVFANCVRNVFPQSGLKKVEIGTSSVMIHHDNLRRKPVVASRATAAFTQVGAKLYSTTKGQVFTTTGTPTLVGNLGPPPRTPSPLPIHTTVATTTVVAGTTTGTSGSASGSHSPILKAQLSAPLRSMTPPLTPAGPNITPSPPPSPSLSPNTNLIKSLLASKVTRNIQKQQQLQDPPVQAVVTNGTKVTQAPIPVTIAVRNMLNPVTKVVTPVRVAVPIMTVPNRGVAPTLAQTLKPAQLTASSSTSTASTTTATLVFTTSATPVSIVPTLTTTVSSMPTTTTINMCNKLKKDVILTTATPKTGNTVEVPTVLLTTRLNGMTKDTQVELCAHVEDTSESFGTTQLFEEATIENRVQNHITEEEDDEGSSNDSFDPLTMLGLKPPKNQDQSSKKTVVEDGSQLLKTVLSTAEVTDDESAKRRLGQDKMYKTSPLLNGLLDKGKVLLPGEESTGLTNGNGDVVEGSEVETLQMGQYISAPEGTGGATTVLIARTVDQQQQMQPQHIQIVQNSNGSAAGTTPIAIVNMADVANQSSSDLSSISDIARTLECASKAISRTNAECTSQLPILAVPASATGGATHIVSVLRLNPQATITLPMNAGQQQFLQTHIVRLPAPTVTLKMEEASELIGLPQISSAQLRHVQLQAAANSCGTTTLTTASGEVLQATLKRPSSALGGTPTTCIILEAKRPRTEVKNPVLEANLRVAAPEENGSTVASAGASATVVKANFQEQRLLLPKPRMEETKLVPVQSTVLLTTKNLGSTVGVPISGSQLVLGTSSSVVTTSNATVVFATAGSQHTAATTHQPTMVTNVLPAIVQHSTASAATTHVATPVKRSAVTHVINTNLLGGSGHHPMKSTGTSAAKDVLAHGEIRGVAANKLHFVCEWRNCHKKFVSPNAVFLHVQKTHMPSLVTQEALCEWDNCDKMKRKKLSLLTHVQDRHCNEQMMQMQALRKQQIAQFGKSSIPPPQPPPPHPGYAPDAALLAIRRHALQYLCPREFVEEKEGPLTKSIRLTAALVLRNLALFCPSACSQLRQHEPELAGLAMSTVESSRTIAQCLLELARPAGQHN